MLSRLITLLLAAGSLHAEEPSDQSPLHVSEPIPPQTGEAIMTVKIPGQIADGTPAPPAAPPSLPSFNVEKTSITDRGNHNLILRKVAPIPLPEPPPLPALDIEDPAVQTRIGELTEKYKGISLTFVSATVYDHKYTFIRWWPNGGAGEELSGWSNLDWNHLSGFSSYEAPDATGEVREHALLMGIGNVDTEQWRKRSASRGYDYEAPSPPVLPDLSTKGPAFLVTKGPTDNAEAIAIMHGLHQLYAKDGERLHQAWLGREKAAKEKAEYLRLHPPVPQDVEVFYWRKGR